MEINLHCATLYPLWRLRPTSPNNSQVKVNWNTFASSRLCYIESEATYQRRQQRSPLYECRCWRNLFKQTVQNREDMKNGAAVLKSQHSALGPPTARVKATKGQSGLRLSWQLSVVSRQSDRCEQTHWSRAAYWHGLISYLRTFQCRCAITSRDGNEDRWAGSEPIKAHGSDAGGDRKTTHGGDMTLSRTGCDLTTKLFPVIQLKLLLTARNGTILYQAQRKPTEVKRRE